MDDIALESAVEDVIGQFSDPLALFRELIQNSIDAGTSEVEVSAEYDEERGLGVVTVADWGEGMTREIIESQLVRLFNSAKDADLTKIGKFGIGFVSVFAVQPALVTVETGRDGEYWRMLLHPDRRYDLVELDQPVEGTTVRLFLRQSLEDFERFRDDAAARVGSWCRFVTVPVLFDGEDVREPFELDGLVVSRFEEEGTRIVVALRERPDCTGEYFNGGLALQESRSRWPHVEYMVDSRYLEHTLARDQLIEDKNFHAALERLDETIGSDLRDATISALRDWPSDIDRYWDWAKICRVALTAWDETVWRQARFPRLRGEPVDVRAVKKARSNNRLMLSRGRASFAHLMPDDYLLLDVRPGSGPAALLAEFVKRDIPVLEDVWVQIPAVTIDAEPAAAAFAAELDVVLRKMGSTPRVIVFGEFEQENIVNQPTASDDEEQRGDRVLDGIISILQDVRGELRDLLDVYLGDSIRWARDGEVRDVCDVSADGIVVRRDHPLVKQVERATLPDGGAAMWLLASVVDSEVNRFCQSLIDTDEIEFQRLFLSL